MDKMICSFQNFNLSENPTIQNGAKNNNPIPSNLIADELIEQAKKYNLTDACYDEKRREQSNIEWKAKCQLLQKAISLGSWEAQKLYFEAMESKDYHRELVYCWIKGHEKEIDVRIVRAFFWEQIAMFDQKERKELIEAYISGNDVVQNIERAEFWKNYHSE